MWPEWLAGLSPPRPINVRRRRLGSLDRDRDGTGRRLPSPAQLADGDGDRHISSIRSSGRRYPSPRPLTSHAKEPPVLPLQSVCLGYAGVFYIFFFCSLPPFSFSHSMKHTGLLFPPFQIPISMLNHPISLFIYCNPVFSYVKFNQIGDPPALLCAVCPSPELISF